MQENILPPAFETQLSTPSSAIGKAACKVNFLQTLGKEIVRLDNLMHHCLRFMTIVHLIGRSHIFT